jgi:hypothetical protein
MDSVQKTFGQIVHHMKVIYDLDYVFFKQF